MKNGELIGEMIAWEEGYLKRINHFLKVYGLAKAIASREQLSSTTMNIVETAAILHDIGIKPCLEKYGPCEGPQQEEVGEKACRALMERCGYTDKEFVDRICWLVVHHHSYDNVQDIDLQILIEADFLVNLDEKQADEAAIEKVRDDHFKTATGKKFLQQLLLSKK